MMIFRKRPSPRSAAPAQPRRAADPRRIWIEEVMGPELPRSASRREAAIAALLSDGGLAAWQALRAHP